jgi:hypothetical protein
LEPNQREFKIDNPNFFQDGINKTHQLLFMNLKPDYFSKAAGAQEMDGTDNQAKKWYKSKIKIEYNAREDNGLPLSSTLYDEVPKVLKRINEYFDATMSLSQVVSPVIFDWILPEVEASPYVNKPATYALLVDRLYGTGKYVESEHKYVLPEKTTNLININGMHFPTQSDVWSQVRVRLLIGPNTRVLFQNEKLLELLGFTESQYTKKIYNNRHAMINSSVSNVGYVVAENPIKEYKFTDQSRFVTKIYHAFHSYRVNYTWGIEMTPMDVYYARLLVPKIKEIIVSIADYLNFNINCVYSDVTKSIKFVLPTDNIKSVSIMFPAELNQRMGYDALAQITNDRNLISGVITDTKIEPGKLIELSNILTNDTGTIFVTCENLPSLTGYGHTTQIMGYLNPADGILQIDNMYKPEVVLPKMEKQITFRFYRYGENGKLMDLAWPVYSYVFGAFTGKPI